VKDSPQHESGFSPDRGPPVAASKVDMVLAGSVDRGRFQQDRGPLRSSFIWMMSSFIWPVAASKVDTVLAGSVDRGRQQGRLVTGRGRVRRRQ